MPSLIVGLISALVGAGAALYVAHKNRNLQEKQQEVNKDEWVNKLTEISQTEFLKCNDLLPVRRTLRLYPFDLDKLYHKLNFSIWNFNSHSRANKTASLRAVESNMYHYVTSISIIITDELYSFYKENEPTSNLTEKDAMTIRLIARWLLSNRWVAVNESKNIDFSLKKRIDFDLKTFSDLINNSSFDNFETKYKKVKKYLISDNQKNALKIITSDEGDLKESIAALKNEDPEYFKRQKISVFDLFLRVISGALLFVGATLIILSFEVLFAYYLLKTIEVINKDERISQLLSFGVTFIFVSLMLSLLLKAVPKNREDSIKLVSKAFLLVGLYLFACCFSSILPDGIPQTFKKFLNRKQTWDLLFSAAFISGIFSLYSITDYWASIREKIARNARYLS